MARRGSARLTSPKRRTASAVPASEQTPLLRRFPCVDLHRIGRVLEIGEARDQAGGGPHASGGKGAFHHHGVGRPFAAVVIVGDDENLLGDRKSTRLNSSHGY